jgi:hypothetical protein
MVDVLSDGRQGSPESLCKKIAQNRDAIGFDLSLMEAAQGGVSHENVCRVLELFAKEVIPKSRESSRGPRARKPRCQSALTSATRSAPGTAVTEGPIKSEHISMCWLNLREEEGLDGTGNYGQLTQTLDSPRHLEARMPAHDHVRWLAGGSKVHASCPVYDRFHVLKQVRVSMVFAIKIEIKDPQARTFEFVAQKAMYGGKHIETGDTVFVFASENEGGKGLKECRNWSDGQPQSELHFKCYRQATNKIVGISDETAVFP